MLEDDLGTAPIAPVDAPAQPELDTSKPEAEAPVDDLDSALRDVFKKAQGKDEPAPAIERDETGKFKSKNPAPEAVKTDQALETKQPEASKPIGEPASWSAEMKAKFATLPPEVQQYVVQRDKETSEAISRLGQTAKDHEPIAKVLEQHRTTFETRGVTFEAGLNDLLKAQKALDSNPIAAIQQIARAYGVDLRNYGDGTQAQGGHTDALTLQIARQNQQIQDLQSKVLSRERTEAEATQNNLKGIVEKFASSKPDFEELSDDIFAQVHATRTAHPNLSTQEVLEKAYEAAQWANPKARQRLLDAQTKEAEAKRLEEAKKNAESAKKAAGLNIKGQPKAQTNSDDVDSVLRATYRKAQAA